MLRVWKYFYTNFENIKQERRLLNFYSSFINTGDLCFDIGAHLGNRAEIFLKLGAKVIAIEPQEECINRLFNKFGNEPKLLLLNKGLSDKSGNLPLYICEEATTISTFSDKWKTGRFSNYKWNVKKIIPVTTLDNLIDEFGMPIFCKIDVEGFELQVLKGLSFPIKYISFEFTREFFDDMKLCINYLLSLGYKQFNCSFKESAKMYLESWNKADVLCQKLELLDDSLLWGDIYAKFS